MKIPKIPKIPADASREQIRSSAEARVLHDQISKLEPHIVPFLDLAFWARKFCERTSNNSVEVKHMREALAEIDRRGQEVREKAREG